MAGPPLEGTPRTVAVVRPAPERRWRVFDHSREGAPRLVSVVCGDIPLCRPAAEAALNAALDKLGRPRYFEPVPERRRPLETVLSAGGRPLCAALYAFHRLRASARMMKYHKTSIGAA